MMLDCFGFASLRCVIGPKNSCHNLNQSNVKLKPNTTWSLAFSRALRRLPVSTLCSHWLIIMVTFFLIGSCHHNWIWFFDTQLKSADQFGYGHSIEIRFLRIQCCIFVCMYISYKVTKAIPELQVD